MSKTIEYNIKVDAGNSVKTLGQLESELAQINEELKGVQVGSQRFNELTKSAQNATKEIGNINKQIEGITGQDKIRGLDGSIKILAGSTQALVGGLGLLGIESEKFGEFEKKAASAIAFGIGLKDVGEGVRKLGGFISKLPGPTKLATTAQKAFNLVLKNNPIGAVVTAIGLVVAGILLFSEKARNLIKTIEPLNKALEATVGFFRKVGQAIGLAASDEEIAAKKFKEATEQRVKDIDNELKVRKAAGEDTVELEREKLKKLIEITEEESQERKDAIANLQAFESGIKKQEADEYAKKEKEKTDKLKAELQKRQDAIEADRLKGIGLLKKYQDEERDLEVAFEEERLALQLERQFKEIDALKINEELKSQIKLQALENYNTKLNELEKQQAEERKQKEEEREQELLDKQSQQRQDQLAFLFADFNLKKQLNALTFEDELSLFDKQRELQKEELEANKASNDAILAFDKETAAARLQIEAAQQAAKLGIVSSALGQVAQAVGEATAAGKSLSIAQATIDTYAAANTALKTYPPPFGQIAAGTAILAGLLNVKKIISTKVPGAPNTSGGVALPSVSSVSPSAPSTPTTQTPNIQDLNAASEFTQRQDGTQPVIQAYVLEGSVTSAQEAASKIRQRRTVGR